MKFKLNTSLKPPRSERIEWFEMAYRVVLPASYTAILQYANGAVPTTNVFDQAHRERLVERMLCLLDSPREDQQNGWYDITVVLSQLDARLIEDKDQIGMKIIPIAALFGGDFVCLDYRRNLDVPAVSVWDHEQSEDFCPRLEYVANSFDEFTQLLR